MVYVPNDPGTEAEALNDWLEGEDAMNWPGSDVDRELDRQIQANKATEAAARYTLAKAAKTGETIPCGYCSRPFIKASYQQAFCCNKGSGNCKDAYWNRMNPRGIYA